MRIRRPLLHEAELGRCHAILTLMSKASKQIRRKSGKRKKKKTMKKNQILKNPIWKVQTRKLTKKKIWTNHRTRRNMSMDGMSNEKVKRNIGITTTNALATTLDRP